MPTGPLVARKLGVTRACVTQLFDLLLMLAPDVQALVLELEAVDGAEPMIDRAGAEGGGARGELGGAASGEARPGDHPAPSSPDRTRLCSSTTTDTLISRQSTGLAQKDAPGRQVALS